MLPGSQGDYQEAIADFDDSKAYFRRGMVELNLNDQAAAAADAAKAKSLGYQPSNADSTIIDDA